mmetsp:Transcript_118509/g.379855  ORF Transcript_118509/g.379855 Transcript_118509/m.379855 type:complete len:171 (-) Transcript_118509:298-810(-)
MSIESTGGFKDPRGLVELRLVRELALRRLLPGAPAELLGRLRPFVGGPSVLLRSTCGARYWWARSYAEDVALGCSAGSPIYRFGRLLLYRWRAVAETRLRGPGARARACETAAGAGEEEWRLADEDWLHRIRRGVPHVAKLCLEGPLRSGPWMEITRELREPREVVVEFC